MQMQQTYRFKKKESSLKLKNMPTSLPEGDWAESMAVPRAQVQPPRHHGWKTMDLLPREQNWETVRFAKENKDLPERSDPVSSK